MKKRILIFTLGAIALLAVIALAKFTPVHGGMQNNPSQPDALVSATTSKGLSLSGPFTHENLSVFLIHGEEAMNAKRFLTLEEAMRQKKAIVHETKDVNELAIENLSRDEEIYVQSGDIVKGGQQDRMLSTDLIVSPRSGKVPIAAFCVEHGRWSSRGKETATSFSESSAMVPSKALKVAANHDKSQTRVWEKVAEAQTKLSRNVSAGVISSQSASSLQLSLENKQVRVKTDEYVIKLTEQLKGKNDVIGYAFAINGKINSADVYASGSLFRKLWPKLIRAAAIEAITEFSKNEKYEMVTGESVKAFLDNAERGRESENVVADRVKVLTKEGDQHLFFETRDQKQNGKWVHRSYVSKQ